MTARPIFVHQLLSTLLVFGAAALPGGSASAQTARLTSSAGLGAEFGYATALEGGVLAIGSPGEAAQTGAVYSFACDSGFCLEAERVIAPDLVAGDLFGSAVALSFDTLAIAAPGQQPAAVYVFVRSGSAWVQQARISSPDGTLSAGFGGALALEGDRLAVGADRASNRAGAVYVYTRTGASWISQARLTPIDAVPGDRFGSSVALSGDSALIGAPFRAGVAPGSHAQGAAYVFVHALGSWSEQAHLSAATGVDGDSFGAAVALDGARALVGAPLANNRIGRAYVFQRAAGAWSEQAQLGAIDGAIGDRFGWSVGLGGDTLVVGAPFAQASCGASYRFQEVGAAWSQLANSSVAVPRSGNLAGWSVATDGIRFLIGAPGFDGASAHRGAGFWFDPIEQIFADGMDDNRAVECVLPAP